MVSPLFQNVGGSESRHIKVLWRFAGLANNPNVTPNPAEQTETAAFEAKPNLFEPGPYN